MKSFGEFISETVMKDYQRPTSLKMSEHSPTDVFGEWRAGDRGGRAKTISVQPKKLRATQSWLDKRWSGKETPEESKHNEHPAAIRTKDGNVHLVDGHHRAADAQKSGKHFTVSAVDVDRVRPYSETKGLWK
jgi:hypothetical protein